MPHQPIKIENLVLKPYQIWNNTWFLLTAGDFTAGKFNTMTVSWGSMGCIWNKPFVQVFARPTRYTHSFLEEYDTFSLCAFGKEFRKDLNTLGTLSGRDCDKLSKTRLHPMAAKTITAPVFEEAELVIECQKMYWSDINPGNFMIPNLDANYPDKDYHRTYYGEILSVTADEKYLQP